LDLQKTPRSKKLQICKKLFKNTKKIEKNHQKTLKKPYKNSQKSLKNHKNLRLIPYKTLKKLSKTLENTSQKTLKKLPLAFPYLTFENNLILRHESPISRTTDFSPNTPIRLLFSGFIDLFI
jgi:hypothetical protein